jgi:hypothetical protein
MVVAVSGSGKSLKNKCMVLNKGKTLNRYSVGSKKSDWRAGASFICSSSSSSSLVGSLDGMGWVGLDGWIEIDLSDRWKKKKRTMALFQVV